MKQWWVHFLWTLNMSMTCEKCIAQRCPSLWPECALSLSHSVSLPHARTRSPDHLPKSCERKKQTVWECLVWGGVSVTLCSTVCCPEPTECWACRPWPPHRCQLVDIYFSPWVRRKNCHRKGWFQKIQILLSEWAEFSSFVSCQRLLLVYICFSIPLCSLSSNEFLYLLETLLAGEHQKRLDVLVTFMPTRCQCDVSKQPLANLQSERATNVILCSLYKIFVFGL